MSSEEFTLSKEEENYLHRLKNSSSFDNLVLSSGGMSGIIMIGCLHYLYSNDMLANVKNFVGCSAGAIISLLLLVGYTPFELNQEIIEIDNEKEFMNINIQNLITNIGLVDNTKILNIFSALIEKKLGFRHGFSELHINDY